MSSALRSCLIQSVDHITKTASQSFSDLASMLESTGRISHVSSDVGAVVRDIGEMPQHVDSLQQHERYTPLVIAQAATPGTQRVEDSVASRIESYLVKHGVPVTASRTNLGTDSKVRSLLLGLYTRRGVGVTRKIACFPLLQELHSLAKSCSIQPAHTSITINVLTDECVREHRDMNNLGCSTVFVCGSFTFGAFVQGSERLCLKRGWFQFQGQIPHEVEHVRGRRISIVYFTPVGFQSIPQTVKSSLIESGFPYELVMKRHAPLLMTLSISKRYPRALMAETLTFELAGGIAFRLGLPDTDLSTQEGKCRYRNIIQMATQQAEGTIVWVSIPCSSWSSLQQLNAHKYGEEWLAERQKRAMPLVHAAVEAVQLALSLGAQ
eukprot:6470472-Amphidinium_carterae.1